MVHLEYRPRILETSNKNYIWWKLFRRIRCRICCRQFHPRQKKNYLLYFRTHKKRWGCVVCFLFGWGNRLKIYSVYNNMIPTSKQLVWVDLPWDKSNGFGSAVIFGGKFLSLAICCWYGNQEKVWQNLGSAYTIPTFFHSCKVRNWVLPKYRKKTNQTPEKWHYSPHCTTGKFNKTFLHDDPIQ